MVRQALDQRIQLERRPMQAECNPLGCHWVVALAEWRPLTVSGKVSAASGLNEAAKRREL